MPNKQKTQCHIARVVNQHIFQTNPSLESDASPPIVIESDFQKSTKNKLSSQKVTNTVDHCILVTCGDDNIKYVSHKQDSTILDLYTRIKLIA